MEHLRSRLVPFRGEELLLNILQRAWYFMIETVDTTLKKSESVSVMTVGQSDLHSLSSHCAPEEVNDIPYCDENLREKVRCLCCILCMPGIRWTRIFFDD